MTFIMMIIIISISEWLKLPRGHRHPELGLNWSLAASLLSDLGNPSPPRACFLICTRWERHDAGACSPHRGISGTTIPSPGQTLPE